MALTVRRIIDDGNELAPPFQIFLDSRYAKTKNEDYENECHFEIPTQNVLKYQAFRLRLKGFTIPISWYIINEYNNTLILNYNSQVYTVTLKEGNYSTTSFPAMFETQVEAATGVNNAITLSLDSYTGKWTFTGASAFYLGSISDGTTCFAFLGFKTFPKTSTRRYPVSGTTTSFESFLPVDFSGTNTLYIQTSLNTGNVEAISTYSATGGSSNFIGAVPVPVEYTGI
jgi:hypothetical protein